jgi:Cu+-exporting ATPase
MSLAAADQAPPGRVELSVRGMTCAACAARVEKRLNDLAGVAASVNLVTGRVTALVPAGVSAGDLAAAVEQAGYQAEVLQPPAADAADAAQLSGRTARDSDDAEWAAYLRRRLVLAAVFFIPLSDVSVLLSLFPAYRFAGWQWVLLILAAPVVGWAAWPFHRAAVVNARHGGCSMDTLVSLGVVAACGWSVYAMFVLDRGQARVSAFYELMHASGGGIYLEVAASVTTFLLAGRFYEARARRTAGEAMRELAAAGASDVCVLAGDGQEERVPVSRLRAGAVFVVRPGERIAADGTVLSGQSAVDRSMMTGEPVPFDAGPGDAVTAGTVAVAGRLIVRADRVGDDTQLARLIALVDRVQSEKAAAQRVADRISGVFVPSVLVLSAVTLAGWLLAGSPVERAFSAALAVLIIACPCALGLATPAALMVACGRGAELGIFIKGYRALEASKVADTVVLDKTGTVTTGVMTVLAVQVAGGATRAEVLTYAGAVEQASGHPIATAIASLARQEHGCPLPQPEGFESVHGLGARGVVGGRDVVVGRARLMAERGIAVPDELAAAAAGWERAGRTVVLAGWDATARGAFAVGDTVKESAAQAVAELHRLGLRTVLLTGDTQAAAAHAAAVTGIGEVIAGALPDTKVEVVAGLRAQGRSVAMVGDGVNDGPALAAADLGLALGTGTDVAISAADIIVLRDDLRAVPEAVRLARATMRTIRQNLGWAFGYNIVAIPVAAAGFCNPLIAGAAMALSSAFVVTNSVRLRRFGAARPDRRRRLARDELRDQGQRPPGGIGVHVDAAAPGPDRGADLRDDRHGLGHGAGAGAG